MEYPPEGYISAEPAMLLQPRKEAEAALIPKELEAQDVQVLALQRGPSAE